jgi:cytochrome c-type biogenesis protein CcmH
LDRTEAALSAQTAASESAGSSGHLTEIELQKNRRRYRIKSLSGALVLVLLVAGVASGIYYYQFSKQQEQQIAATGDGPAAGPMMGGTPPNPLEMVARLERRLRENPDDLQGQMMAGRSYMTLQRPEDAKKAWGKVAELDPGNTEAQYNLGILLIQTTSPDNPKGFEDAMAHLDRALMIEPGMPSALFYRGVALIHLKRLDEAEKDWNNALKGLPPGEDADFVKDELRKLKSGNPLS